MARTCAGCVVLKEGVDWLASHIGLLVDGLVGGAMVFLTFKLYKVTSAQVEIAKRQASIAEAQSKLEEEMHRREGPSIVLYWNDFDWIPPIESSMPLWAAVSIENVGRMAARVQNLDIEVLDPPDPHVHSYTLQRASSVNRMGGVPYPDPPEFLAIEALQERPKVASYDWDRFLVQIPTTVCEGWKRVRLTVKSPGIPAASMEVDWDWQKRRPEKR